jgi:hypothetical protein
MPGKSLSARGRSSSMKGTMMKTEKGTRRNRSDTVRTSCLQPFTPITSRVADLDPDPQQDLQFFGSWIRIRIIFGSWIRIRTWIRIIFGSWIRIRTRIRIILGRWIRNRTRIRIILEAGSGSLLFLEAGSGSALGSALFLEARSGSG